MVKTHNIKIYDSSSLDDQLEKSSEEVYSKLVTQTKVCMTIWLSLIDIANEEEKIK